MWQLPALWHSGSWEDERGEYSMRYLTVQRERALACFAMKYACILNCDQGQFIAENTHRTLEDGLGDWPMLRNGESIRIAISEEETTFFSALQTEHKLMVTPIVTIGAGTEDVKILVQTEFDGNRKLSLHAKKI